MEANFATMFEDTRHERSLILLLSITDPDKLKQSKFTVHAISIIKQISLEKKQTANVERIYSLTIIRIVFSV